MPQSFLKFIFMKYLKLFENVKQYESYKNGLDYLKSKKSKIKK